MTTVDLVVHLLTFVVSDTSQSWPLLGSLRGRCTHNPEDVTSKLASRAASIGLARVRPKGKARLG